MQKKWAYYNEIDPNAAEWLRQLIKMGEITDGEVDERSIEDVTPSDVIGFQRVHFFAGIGGWEYALKLAGWPDDRPVWAGSCPCQSLSSAGKRKGFADERHLWPAFFWLIQQCRPESVLGEQVSSKLALKWWDLVANDLEGEDYACTAVDLPAASVGTFHLRYRLFWVAHSLRGRQYGGRASKTSNISDDWAQTQKRIDNRTQTEGFCTLDLLANPKSKRQCTDKLGRDSLTGKQLEGAGQGRNCSDDGSIMSLEYPDIEGLQICQRNGSTPSETSGTSQGEAAKRTSANANPWADAIWLPCADGKARPAQRSIFPLAHGLPKGMVRSGDPGASDIETEATSEARVMRLKGYGNAVVPQLAAEFIKAFVEP